SEVVRIEEKYPNPMSHDEVFGYLKDFRYIVPQGSPMSGIGNDLQVGSLSNCFVIGLDGHPDSYGGVIRIDEEQVQLMKRRGGVGHDLSHIRPKGMPVKNSALTSTGLVPFMERYSNSTREVAQDGRRGALMLTVSIKHPDSEAFIDAKMTEGKITGANVSVRIDDDFMKAAAEGTPYIQQYPIKSDNPSVTKEVDAKSIWEKIIHNAWKSAEPGVLFWDTITREALPDCYADLGFETISTNPCGEIPLCPYDSCRLLAINLYSYVIDPFTPQARFDYDKLALHTAKAQRIMDDIIDLEMEKIEAILNKIDRAPETEEVKSAERNLGNKIRTKTLMGRRTGVGTTGEGDMLA
ncbi:MAG: ribonucleoside-diphosphate reductase, adenosylcobalamin-dependent, partial [Muribaculaceae bacterium]|nr:ribonucleoside-diphosphate reductase, adenosylcobalamin-dependent [Muribaculaceae bacterium]